MLKMKTVLTYVLLLSFVVLSACGQKAAESTTSTSPAAKTDVTEAPKASTKKEAVQIEFWYGLGGKLGENMKSLIDSFNASQSDVIVKGIVQGSYTETQQKLQAAIATKSAPAAVLFANQEWAKKGLFVSMNELIANDPTFNADDFVPAFIDQGKVDDKQYFLPMYGTTQVLYYNKEMFKNAGITTDQIKTWEGLAEAAKKLTVKSGKDVKVLGWEPMWGRENLMDAVLSRGGKVLSDDGKTVTIDSKEWIDTFEAFRTWIHQDKTMAIHSGGQGWEYWYKTIDDVMQGRAAGYTGSSGDQGDLDFTKLAAAPQPGWNGHAAAPVAEAIMAGIPSGATPEQQSAAYQWLKYFTNSENTAQWSMKSGYIAVRKSASEDPKFKEFNTKNPQSLVPLEQAKTGSKPFIDPTGAKITDALKIAADKVEIENIPASQALKEAKVTAQRELDKVLGTK
jgi:multiple sugar transport system substrate-binding protein